MKKKLRIFQIVLAAIMAIVAFRAYPGFGIVTHTNLRGSITDFPQLSQFIPSGTPSESNLGIPHQFFESSDFWVSLLFTRRSIRHGHAFRPGEWLSIAQREEVGTLLSDPSSYDSWMGEAMCGGFHADFYFRWMDSADEAIVCLGCGEVLLIRSGKKFRCTLKSSTHDKLIEISKEAEQAAS
jgi:hypothetical protein